MNEYLQRAYELEEEIRQNRRAFHQFAETGFDLPQTVQRVMQQLKEYGYEPRLVGKAGVTCTAGQGPHTILLRADMDALPMAEETGLPFAAGNGHCHSCAHDCHTAMLLGAAKMLKEREGQLPGRVRFMFQPAEELLSGAQDMVDGGLLDDPVDAALALHLRVGTEESAVGSASYCRGEATFSGDCVRITVKGQDAHGSRPYAGVDAITIAAHIVVASQEILAREIPCTEHSVLLIGTIQGGTSCNTVAGQAVLEASIRTTSQQAREHLKQRLKEIAVSTAHTFRGEAEVEFVYGMYPLYNNPELCDEVSAYLGEILAPEKIQVLPTSNGGEDFAVIAQKVPAMMIHLGAGSIAEGHRHSMHNPHMVVDEAALPLGAALYAHCATRYLQNRARAVPG